LPAYIAPTYRCNLKCEHCYSARYASEFPHDLDWPSFINVCKSLIGRYSGFCIIGGEPTQWKFINEAILVLKNKNKRVSVFTNCIKPLRVYPDSLFINASAFWNDSLQSTFLSNLQRYKHKSRIILRFNIGEECTKLNIEDAVWLACKYASSVSLACLFPTKIQTDLGVMIYNLVKQLTSKSVTTRISRATPLCIFNSEQIKCLVKMSRLKGQCGLPSNSLYIHPDARTIQPCPELGIRGDIKSLDKLSPKLFLKKDIELKKLKRISSCLICKFFKNGQCCGGCLAYDLLPLE
jgi:MoaA/NifB/PqqE/SkfB family radical SAM enzyme